jgi:plastocyanin
MPEFSNAFADSGGGVCFGPDQSEKRKSTMFHDAPRRARLAKLAGLGALVVGCFCIAMTGCSASLDIGGSTSTSSPPPPPASSSVTVNVEIKLFKFIPDTLVVAPGTTVVWTNHDDIAHTVTSGTPDHVGGILAGKLDAQGSTYSYRFDTPGEYPYFCEYHTSMVGKVIVNQP